MRIHDHIWSRSRDLPRAPPRSNPAPPVVWDGLGLGWGGKKNEVNEENSGNKQTIQENIGKEVQGVAKRKHNVDVPYEELWHVKSRLVRGQEGKL